MKLRNKIENLTIKYLIRIYKTVEKTTEDKSEF